MVNDDPLQRLVRSEEELLDKDLLAGVLEGLVFLDPGKGKVIFTREARSLKARKMVMLHLLGRKALAALPGAEVAEAATPKQIEEATGLKGGTVRPNLRRLYAEGVVEQHDNGYSVPGYRLPEAARVIREE